MRLLLTGCAGFIGSHVAQALLARGDEIVGIDNLNHYYAPALKHVRLAQLEADRHFHFHQLDIADEAAINGLAESRGPIDAIMHLAAQAGVRHSLRAPLAYVDANLRGQAVMLGLAARMEVPIVYASSSSVYGANSRTPFSEADRADAPVSLYAATKRGGELLAHSYAQTHGLRATGLRYFTVYGRFGRPDMAPWLFTDAILSGREITVFDGGEMERDFTHVSDIVEGTVAALDRLVARPGETAPIYNLGNNKPVRLLDFIGEIERAAGRKAAMRFAPRPPGDVSITCADITLAGRDLGFAPEISIRDGIGDFVEWFRREGHGIID